jgi:predicted transposase/invertase (TIGR01784 family)
VVQTIEIARFSKEEREKYEAIMRNERDQYAILKCARDEGREEGLEKGVTVGMERGKSEIARNMLGEGMEPALVARYTNLSLEAVEALR